jgi:hypothetical protein
VRVIDVSEQAANARASKFAQELYCRFLLKFGDEIKLSEPPRRIRTRAHCSCGKWWDAILNKAKGKRIVATRSTTILSPLKVSEVARDVELRAITPQVPTSGQLYAAIAMYATGLESQNKVVRFLVFYSALALAALFKC